MPSCHISLLVSSTGGTKRAPVSLATFFIAGISMPLRRSSASDFAMRGGASKKNLGEVLKMVLAQARSRMTIREYPLATPSNVHPVDCMSFVSQHDHIRVGWTALCRCHLL